MYKRTEDKMYCDGCGREINPGEDGIIGMYDNDPDLCYICMQDQGKTTCYSGHVALWAVLDREYKCPLCEGYQGFRR